MLIKGGKILEFWKGKQESLHYKGKGLSTRNKNIAGSPTLEENVIYVLTWEKRFVGGKCSLHSYLREALRWRKMLFACDVGSMHVMGKRKPITLLEDSWWLWRTQRISIKRFPGLKNLIRFALILFMILEKANDFSLNLFMFLEEANDLWVYKKTQYDFSEFTYDSWEGKRIG